MPGLPQRNAQFSNVYSSSCSAGSVSVNGIWSKHGEDVTFDQLQKFWSELSPHARQELLRIDKQTLLEQARKNLYCSRCNGLLLEGFSQIVMYGKSLPQEVATAGHLPIGRTGASKNQYDSGLDIKPWNCLDDTQDPSVHPWGGLVATRDGILTLLDCFLDAKSLTALQNVFDSARVRERECELLYPDACGGGGRGWINQGMANYGRGHGARETCALHTARLSCDTLVDFWSSLGDEAQKSLLRMKEEDFIERLMYRFDSKRFCRDCRRNVIREFKELKELKRTRKEPRCTSWFCVADTAFQYEVSDDMVQADWHQSLTNTIGTYHHFEWAVGTGEGKSDILEFEDVGMNGSIQVNGLDLGGLSACFITLRAWKLDGRCTEHSVKAHAMKGQTCVHRRLVVGDGHVTITKGECIRRFFEHAEEAEEEEDDDSLDKDGNELDGEGSRPQKHAKSPELAREFLLDAATVIFKKQVEKAFREGTARQNAHIIFISLALKLLEERVHVACKEIITLEKQTKLLEEVEKEKREEEERKERKRTKEREKKLRRKERLKGKEMEKERQCAELKRSSIDSKISTEESTPSVHNEPNSTVSSEGSISETGDIVLALPLSPDIHDEQSSKGCDTFKMQNLRNDSLHSCNVADGELSSTDGSGSFLTEQSKSPHRKVRFNKEFHPDTAFKLFDRCQSVVGNNSGVSVDKSQPRSCGGCMETPSRCINGVNRQVRQNLVKSNIRICGPKFSEKFHSSNNRMRDRCDLHSCGCKLHSDYREKDGPHVSTIKTSWEIKTVNKSESASDVSRPFYRNNRYNQGFYVPDSCGIPKTKLMTGNIPPNRYPHHAKKVWEPMESRKKYPRSNSDSDVTLRSSSFRVDECEEGRCHRDETDCQQADNIIMSSGEQCLNGKGNSDNVDGSKNYRSLEDNYRKESISPTLGTDNRCQGGLVANASYNLKDSCDKDISIYSMDNVSDPIMSSTSSFDKCSSCLSEGNISAASSSTQNVESWSTLDSEDASQQSDGRELSKCGENGFQKYPNDGLDDKHKTNGGESSISRKTTGFPMATCVVGANVPVNLPTKNANNAENGRLSVDMGSHQHCMIPPMHNQGIHFPMITAPSTMAYYHQSPVSWSAVPANGLMPFPQPNYYSFSSPLGYGLPTNRPPSHFCMQYGALQSLPTSILNVGQLPVYQLVNKANGGNSNDLTENSKLTGAREAINLDRPAQNGQTPPLAPSCGEDGHTGISAKSHSDSTNFSLFHFGGPVAVAKGYNLNQASLKEGVGEFASNLPADCTRADLACSQKETHVEEYSLFAVSNATKFSFY